MYCILYDVYFILYTVYCILYTVYGVLGKKKNKSSKSKSKYTRNLKVLTEKFGKFKFKKKMVEEAPPKVSEDQKYTVKQVSSKIL